MAELHPRLTGPPKRPRSLGREEKLESASLSDTWSQEAPTRLPRPKRASVRPAREVPRRSHLSAIASSTATSDTSPLYALRECFHRSPLHRRHARQRHGVLSLIFWSLIVVISSQVPGLRHAGGQPRRRGDPRAMSLARARGLSRDGGAGCSSGWDSSARRCSTGTASSPQPSRSSRRGRYHFAHTALRPS